MRDEFDEVETIDRNPKSWVAWKREAERLQGIIDGMALAAMDSEPAPESEKLALENLRSAMEGIGHIRRTLEETFGGLHGTHVEPDVLAECKAICDAIYAAYRHAQPAPVVPEEKPMPNPLSMYAVDAVAAIAEAKGWNACRAAMLQAQSDDDGEPTDDERIMAIEGIHNCERCGDEGWVVSEMGITRCACGQTGNSQVIPDGSAVAALTGIPMIPDGYVMVPKEPTEEMLQASYREASVYSPTAYRAMIAAAPQEVKP